MKKIFSMFIAALCSMSVFAGDIIVADGISNGTYVEGAVQIGTTTDVNVYIVAEQTIAHALQSDIYLPDGLTAVSGTSTIDGFDLVFTPHPELGNCVRLLWVNMNGDRYINAQTPLLAAKVAVSAVSTLSAGNVEVRVNNLDYAESYNNETDDFVTEITLQKTAVIEEMPEGFGVTVSPFVAKDGDITLNFNYKSAKDIKNLSFDVQLPEGIFFMDDAEWDPANVNSQFTASCSTSAPSFTVQLGDGDIPTSATIKVAGTYSAKTKKYINESENYSSLATITASVMTPENEYVDDWENAIMQEGLSTIKLSNIVLEDVEGIKYTGESLASVIYGKPATQEAILYGNYDNATTDAFTTALKNVAFANTTAATFAEGALLEDVILTKDNTNITFYTRTSENYGTTVLPYDLEEDLNCTLYTVKEISTESIVIEETDFVAANTPCIFKGTITAYGEFVPTLGAIDDQIVGTATFKGTYETTNIAAGAGYYISSDGKFYADGATVRPFRAYFKGNVSSVKSFSVLVDTANGLIDITDQLSDEAIYSLQGIRMNNVQKGINIKGGKKVLVK